MTAGNAGMFPHLPSRGHQAGAALTPLYPVTLIGFLEIAIPSSATQINLCIFNYLGQNAEIGAPYGKQTRLCYRAGTWRMKRTGLNTFRAMVRHRRLRTAAIVT
jgi:hypothetical protein